MPRLKSDSVAAIVPSVSATLDTVSDQGDSDAEPATVHTVAATEHTSPDIASALLRFVVLCCQKSLMSMLRHMRLNWVLVQEEEEELKRNRIVLEAVEAAVLPGALRLLWLNDLVETLVRLSARSVIVLSCYSILLSP